MFHRPLSRMARLVATSAVMATTAAAAAIAITATAGPAAAATSQFRGMNWAQLGDNFSTSPLVVQGLSQSDSYATVQAKANALYDDMASTMGINTVRLPINTQTVANTTWWNAYRGAIDAATARGFKVILAFWTDHNSGARIANLAAWNTMWSSVTSAYGSNTNVYFEPMNEPGGYSSAQWRDIAATWLSTHYSAVPSRVLIGGTGASQDLRDVCNDSRFNSTLLSFHHYAFFYGSMTYDAWRSHMQTRLGNCASRAVATEFGGPMDNGLNYADANSTDNFVRHIRAMAQVMRDNQMGGTYWPALGGKNSGSGHDWYSMFALSGSGTNLNLTIRNTSGADRIRYAYGDTIGGGDPTTPPPSGTHYRINNVNSGKAMDVIGQSTADSAEIKQWSYLGGSNQKWRFEDAGSGYFRIVNQNSGKCLDVASASTADGANVVQWTCGNGQNQQWQWQSQGSNFRLVARHSGKCLDVYQSGTGDGADIQQWTCGSANNQRWTRTAV
ncbi:glycosyl hydrolase family 5 [Micromonospora ureilytica]|uniref:Glycosyl hydrolase family 5 n=2 Tax=Micromonospora ureilytica TaxID=709868 RepID=A0A3N9Y0A2_9ACTN|nr:glycosyl hydrolase family 5 [Micromonospora ureilytica]